jgi:hypothetical protein
MDLKIVNRVSQFPKIVDFEDLVEIRSGLFQLSFSHQKSVARVQFWNSKFHVAPYLCRPKQNQVYEDKSVNKSTRSSRPPRFHEMLINELMSGICPFGANTQKNRCHLSPTMTTIAMPVMWPLNHKLPINW